MQPALFGGQPRFDSGVSLTPTDHVRLGAQLRRVIWALQHGWVTVPDIHDDILRAFGISDPEPSISAQIRNAKKAKHGGFAVERRRVGNTYQFRVA